MNQALMDDLTFLRRGVDAPPADKSLYHIGLLPGSPVSDFTAAGHSFPLFTFEYRNREEGSYCEGAIVAMTDDEHKKAIAKVDRYIVEWIGRVGHGIDGGDIKEGKGVGPGGNFMRAVLKDKAAQGFECVPENCEPLSKYIFIFPASSRQDLHTGYKPSLWAMRNGTGADDLRRQIEADQAQLEARRRQYELMIADQNEAAEAAEKESCRRPGRPRMSDPGPVNAKALKRPGRPKKKTASKPEQPIAEAAPESSEG